MNAPPSWRDESTLNLAHLHELLAAFLETGAPLMHYEGFIVGRERIAYLAVALRFEVRQRSRKRGSLGHN